MYLLENPVLQRELLVNLRMGRSFILLLVYQALLAAVVFFAWPQENRLEANATAARDLVNMFFLGQYILSALMAPSFAAAAITGEKERKTYEMLLASPLKPSAISLGKLMASLVHILLLIFASLPIVMLCLPLGGVDYTEILAAYLGLLLSVITFGMISIACSSYFQRTAASLVASYLLILPLALAAVLVWKGLEGNGQLRLLLTLTALPAIAGVICTSLFLNTSARMLNPPDVGSEGKDVIDLEQEAEEVVGLVIQRDQFPDRLFAPPKRNDLMPDGANPIYDKEIHSEIFSQGTLMLRLVIQVSMFLAIPIMAPCLFIFPDQAAWYIGYVVVFNMLVGPVFSAGSVTSERERQTLDLLLTTTITPWQILWGKLVAGLRISSVLTLFLAWPLLLACVMVMYYWENIFAVLAYAGIILTTCATTAVLAMFCSVIFRKTSMSLMTSYMLILTLFCAPLPLTFFVKQFVDPMEQGSRSTNSNSTRVIQREEGSIGTWIHNFGISSPFAAAFSVPLTSADGVSSKDAVDPNFPPNWTFVGLYFAWSAGLIAILSALMIWLFNSRWRVSQ